MIAIDIPGRGMLKLRHLVLDYNGTVACDGRLIAGVEERLEALSGRVEIHVLTADTFGSAARELTGVPCRLSVIPEGNQADAKREYIRRLGADSCACMGNGVNDRLMLEESGLGVAILQTEGASPTTMLAADVVVPGIGEALDLLIHPLRLAATLRD